MEYQDVVERKIKLSKLAGFNVDAASLHASTMGHQRDAILWAARRGRALLALSFGLGKTHITIELMRLVHEITGKHVLVICPLGARHQFTTEDGPRLGVHFQYVTDDTEALAATTPYLITNYERVRDGSITADFVNTHLGGVALDEGSTLRDLGSKTYNTFTALFRNVDYRFVATATPSPNNYREIINYAQFLGISDTGQCLTRWFGRNPDKAGDLRLHPHHEKEFWMWVASWALFVTRPSDLDYADTGYDLPPLNVQYHRIATDHTRAFDQTDYRGQRYLLVNAANGIQQAIREKRASLDTRIQKAAEIVESAAPDTHWLIWHHLEDERHAICEAIPDAVDVFGSQTLELREQRIMGFAHGEYRILATKPEIAGSGCNFQRHCHSNIFVGVNYSFEDFIQAIHRTDRFQQPHAVDVHIIHTDAEDEIVDTLKRKWEQHNRMVAHMTEIVRQYGLVNESMQMELRRSIGVTRQVKAGRFFTAVHNDCVDEVRSLPDNSVDHICTSIPFSKHYEYSANYNDFGHNDSDDSFFEQMDYLTPDLLRVLKPGRVAAIHVKDLINYGRVSGLGMAEITPFSDMTVAHFRKHGFIFNGRITIVTDVVRENASTYRLGWSEQCKDGSKMSVGMPEYLLLFRKLPTDHSNAYADEPVAHDKETYTRMRWQVDAHSYWRSAGNRLLTPDEVMGMKLSDVYQWFKGYSESNVYDYKQHVALGEGIEMNGHLPSGFMLFAPASWSDGVWTDVNFMRSLNGEQARKRLENHVCPLPFDIVERSIERFTNPDELVLDPFGGLCTVPYCAIKMGRRAYSVELNEDYWRWGVKYCEAVEQERNTPTLFDLIEAAA